MTRKYLDLRRHGAEARGIHYFMIIKRVATAPSKKIHTTPTTTSRTKAAALSFKSSSKPTAFIMFSSTIKNLLLLALAGSAIALPLDTANIDTRDPKKDIGIGISFKYPFKASEAGAVSKRDKDAISFKYPIFKAADGATAAQGDVEKRDKDAITFKYPIFRAAEGTAVDKRDKDAISFKYPIFSVATAEEEGTDGGDAVEKREPKSPYADAIAAADPRDILG